MLRRLDVLRGAIAAGAALALLAAPRVHAATFNIEIDWMDAPDHSHYPSDAEIAAIVQMFACHGHTLNIVRSNAVTHFPVLVPDPFNQNNYFGYSGVPYSFGAIKAANFNHAGIPGWHYCLFAHQYGTSIANPSGSSGLGEIFGDDFMVTLGAFSGQTGTPFDKAATLAHEFGHNLGLTHCGANGNCDDSSSPNWVGQYENNLPSIMSYFYQLSGVRTNLLCQGLTIAQAAPFKEIDYSNGRMCALYEATLDEHWGSGLRNVDWNCNGQIDNSYVAHDLNGTQNGWCGAATGLQPLADYDEWANLVDVTFTRTPQQLENVPTVSCITADEAEAHERNACAQPALATEGCLSSTLVYMNAALPFSGDGRCSAPYRTFPEGYSAAGSGSSLILYPGVYDVAGTFILNKPLTLLCPGQTFGARSAVIQ